MTKAGKSYIKTAVAELDDKELVADTLSRLAHILGVPPSTPPIAPALLSRHWTVFQVPSATTPNYAYFVVGSRKHGWRCSCIGFQAHGACYHVTAVTQTLEVIASERRTARRSTNNQQQVRRRRHAKHGGSPLRYKGGKQ